jgi:O-antigen/teichoic acid export membrane protein
MLATVGINHSLLRALGGAGEDRRRSGTLVVAALVPTLALAAIVCAFFWAARHAVAGWLDSPGVATAMEACTPGLFLFAVNKQLMAAINGWRRMRTFALLTALRYLGLLAALWLAAWRAWPADALMGIFSVAELALFVVAGAEVARHCGRPVARELAAWMREHVSFGLKSAAAAVLLELNAKVDIWMLGLWLSDAKVGYYTWAAMFAEGFWQILVVLQNNLNPLLAKHLAAGELREVEALSRKFKRRSFLLVLALGLASAPAYAWIVAWLDPGAGFEESIAPYWILVAGVVGAAAWSPMAQILLMANQPLRHSLLMLATVVVNVAAIALLIPALGLEGAALGTAIAVCASAFFLVWSARRWIGVRL